MAKGETVSLKMIFQTWEEDEFTGHPLITKKEENLCQLATMGRHWGGGCQKMVPLLKLKLGRMTERC